MSELSPTRAEVEVQVRGLGRSLVIPPPADDTVDLVMARLTTEPAPTGSSWQRMLAAIGDTGRRLLARWRLAVAVLVTVLLAVFVASPAGAGIREWLGFGAVVVVQDDAPEARTMPSAGPSVAAGLPAGTSEVSLPQARSMVTFGVGVPAALGDPDRVGVSDDRRVVVLQWSDAAPAEGQASPPVQLDQIAGSPDPYYVKKVFEDVEFTTVNGREAVWLKQPHPIVVVDPSGVERTQTARQSGPSLIWQRSGVTLRLEGVAALEQAVTIAESVQ